MILHVRKFPSPDTVLSVRQMADGAPAPEAPWEVMTLQEMVTFLGAFQEIIDDGAPAYDPATEKLVDAGIRIEPTRRVRDWQVVALTQEEIDAIADATERAEIKAMRDQIATDINESQADQAQAQVYIDIAAPTNAERNQEVQNSAKRDKAAEQRFRRLARINRFLLKTL